MSAVAGILKFALQQVGGTALRVVTQKAGVELGRVVIEKGAEQIKKHVTKEPEQVAVPQIKTGNAVGDMAVHALMTELAKRKKGKDKSSMEQQPETSLTEQAVATAENVGGIVSEKTGQTVAVAQDLGQRFLQGFRKP